MGVFAIWLMVRMFVLIPLDRKDVVVFGHTVKTVVSLCSFLIWLDYFMCVTVVSHRLGGGGLLCIY